MGMCITMLLAGYFYPGNLDVMSLSGYPLLIYCVLDIPGNSLDMIIHHISTLMAGLALGSSTYETQNLPSTRIVIQSLIFTEVSTIFLDLIHLGYRHMIIKLGFFLTFTYFRVLGLPWLFILNPETCYFCTDRKDYVCDSNSLCHLMWSTGIFTLMLLNSMWFCKLIRKMLKKNNPKPTIKG